jgi:hypothetical protein
MRMRRLLDYVAALKFLVSCDIPNFKAILKARSDFKKMCPDFLEQRKENLQKTIAVPKERTQFSLLWKFYAQGKKRFSQLPI